MDADLRDLERKARSGEPAAILAYGHALVRAGQVTPPNDTELLDSLGHEAWIAWITPGAEWGWTPNSVEFGDAYAEFSENNDTHPWSRVHYVDGLAVRRRADGAPMVVRTHYRVDADGDWDEGGDDDYPVGTPPAEFDRGLEIVGAARSWVDYFGWVEEQGRDPLREMTGLSRREPDSTWRFEFEQEQARGRAGRTLIPGRVLVRKASRLQGKRWVSVPLGELPEAVVSWLSVVAEPVMLRDQKTGKIAPALVSEVQNLDDVRSSEAKIVKDGEFFVTVETTVSGGVIQPTVDEIREASRVQLQRATEDLAKADREVARLATMVRRCERCDNVIYQDGLGSWIDSTGGDGCEDGVHVPGQRARMVRRCERCDNVIYQDGLGSWIDSTGGDGCEDGVHVPGQRARTPWGTFVGGSGVRFCDACGELPAETVSEHEPGCSLAGQDVCALHHVCDGEA